LTSTTKETLAIEMSNIIVQVSMRHLSPNTVFAFPWWSFGCLFYAAYTANLHLTHMQDNAIILSEDFQSPVSL